MTTTGNFVSIYPAPVYMHRDGRKPADETVTTATTPSFVTTATWGGGRQDSVTVISNQQRLFVYDLTGEKMWSHAMDVLRKDDAGQIDLVLLTMKLVNKVGGRGRVTLLTSSFFIVFCEGSLG